MKIKKTLIFIMVIILVLIPLNASAIEKDVIFNYLSGDADSNNILTAADARIILRASAKLENLETEAIAICDVNNDLKITSSDARLILRKAAKLKNETTTDFKLSKISVNEQNNQINSYETRGMFNLESVITGDNKYNTIIVKGKIVDLEEYEISWTDENNETWGPFSRSIITVETDKIYHGNFKSKNKQIKILYPHSLSQVSDESVKIEKGKEYVFSNCWLLDEKYEEQNKDAIFYGYDKSIVLADAIMGGAWNSMMPVEGNTVTLYHEYLNDATDIDKKIIPFKTENAVRLTNSEALKSGYFISVDIDDFENYLSGILSSFFNLKKGCI